MLTKTGGGLFQKFFIKQKMLSMSCVFYLAPPRLYQYVPYYDNSATHNKREELTLSVGNLGAKWGGRKRGLRDSTIVEGCVGNKTAILWYLPGRGTGEWEGGPKWLANEQSGAVMKVCTLKVGDVDFSKFRDDDPPPFYDIEAQRYDRPMSERKKISERIRYLLFSLSHTHAFLHTFTHTVGDLKNEVRNCQENVSILVIYRPSSQKRKSLSSVTQIHSLFLDMSASPREQGTMFGCVVIGAKG